MRLLTRGRVALLTIIAALAVVAASTGTWITGTSEDPVLGTSPLTADGGTAASGLVGLALVVVASVIAAMVSGLLVRRVVLTAGVLAALGGAALAARAVVAPESILGPVAAATVGRTGSLPVQATTTGYAVCGLVAAVLLALVAVAALATAHRWPLPSRKYERVEGASGSTETVGQRGERVRSDWEALSEGNDPTDLPPDRSR